jgi:hypothetical protein
MGSALSYPNLPGLPTEKKPARPLGRPQNLYESGEKIMHDESGQVLVINKESREIPTKNVGVSLIVKHIPLRYIINNYSGHEVGYQSEFYFSPAL